MGAVWTVPESPAAKGKSPIPAHTEGATFLVKDGKIVAQTKPPSKPAARQALLSQPAQIAHEGQ
jgi:hypothetical protein